MRVLQFPEGRRVADHVKSLCGDQAPYYRMGRLTAAYIRQVNQCLPRHWKLYADGTLGTPVGWSPGAFTPDFDAITESIDVEGLLIRHQKG